MSLFSHEGHLKVDLTVSLDPTQFATILHLFTRNHELQEAILAAIDDLKTVVSTLVTDTSTALKDIADKLAALAANQTDPAVTAGITDAVTALNTLDAQIKAADPGPQA